MPLVFMCSFSPQSHITSVYSLQSALEIYLFNPQLWLCLNRFARIIALVFFLYTHLFFCAYSFIHSNSDDDEALFVDSNKKCCTTAGFFANEFTHIFAHNASYVLQWNALQNKPSQLTTLVRCLMQVIKWLMKT